MSEQLRDLPKVGDVVETLMGGKWVRVVVTEEYRFIMEGVKWEDSPVAYYYVRREGKPASWPSMKRVPGNLRAPLSDRTTGNVFADWLDDNGEPAAAEKLRRAFPMG